ncbi:MAG: VOC family protein [Bacteroidetes bacterium]|nr:VOC family protein [Bacteroidota bacterium]
MAALQAYLIFDGNCEEAFRFYQTVFGGDFEVLSRFGAMPAKEGESLPLELAQRILHVSLPLGANTYLLGSDTMGEQSGPFIPGNNIQLSLNAQSMSDADRLYSALSAGGQQTMPMQHSFWGAYFGMLKDKFGIGWLISFEEKNH